MQAAAARAAAKAAKTTNLERRAAAEEQQQQALVGGSANGDGTGADAGTGVHAGAGAGADASQPASRPEPAVEALEGAGGPSAPNGAGSAPSPIYPDEMTTTQQRIVKGPPPLSPFFFRHTVLRSPRV